MKNVWGLILRADGYYQEGRQFLFNQMWPDLDLDSKETIWTVMKQFKYNSAFQIGFKRGGFCLPFSYQASHCFGGAWEDLFIGMTAMPVSTSQSTRKWVAPPILRLVTSGKSARLWASKARSCLFSGKLFSLFSTGMGIAFKAVSISSLPCSIIWDTVSTWPKPSFLTLFVP